MPVQCPVSGGCGVRQRLHAAIISNRCMEGSLPLTLISLDNGAHCDHVSLQGEGIQNV